MYLDQLPCVRVTDLRRSAALTSDMTHIAVTLQGDDGAGVSSEVRVVHFRMRSGGVFLQFLCERCGPRAHHVRAGFRYWCEGKPAVRRAQHRIERLKATRFHGAPV
jgi:hypothetical protein